MAEPEIVLKSVWDTFPIEIKFDRKISNLIGFVFRLSCICPLVKPIMKDDFTPKFLMNSPGVHEAL